MNNEQYRNLMWHLLYTESLLENVADANAVGGGGIVNARFANQSCASSCRLVYLLFCRVPMRNVRSVNHWSGIVRCGF